MADKLFNALKTTEILSSGTMKVYGLLSGKNLDRRSRPWPSGSP